MRIVRSALAGALLVGVLAAADSPRGSQYIGEYGDEGGVLYILEKDGKLEALVKKSAYYPLTAVSDEVFTFP
ncbi:MAG: hypothetical protein ABI823_07265, partial [Bryobacteraceae bacterium]